MIKFYSEKQEAENQIRDILNEALIIEFLKLLIIGCFIKNYYNKT